MSLLSILPVVVAATLPLSTIAAREIQRRVQPARLEMARRGERYLQRKTVPEAAKEGVRQMLDTAFGMRGMLMAIFVAAPIVSALLIVSRRVRASLAEHNALVAKNPEYRELQSLHASIMLANNPVLVPITAVWVAIWLKPAIVIARSFDLATPSAVDGGAVMHLVEQRAHAHAHAH